MEYRLTEPFTKDKTAVYRAGDKVYVTGTIYTARDVRAGGNRRRSAFGVERVV